MGRKKEATPIAKEVKPIRRAIDPEAREKQLIALATNVAEQQLRDGTASSQVICHYLKLGSMERQLELEKIKNENALLAKKVEVLDSQQRTEELYADAIAAMKRYTPNRE